VPPWRTGGTQAAQSIQPLMPGNAAVFKSRPRPSDELDIGLER
jgi:hypothetical protein